MPSDEIQASPRVSIVMVTYNSAHVVVNSLVGLPDSKHIQLIVVDNLSTDDSILTVQHARPDAMVIGNTENSGFARAVNLGAQSATSDYVLLLNPDAQITAESLARLVSTMDSDESVGISAPLVTDPDGQFASIDAGFAPTILRMGLYASGLSRIGKWIPALEGHYLFRDSKIEPLREVDWVSGGCLLIRRDLWAKLDGLTTRWFMYAEDIEICLRARKLGMKVVLNPGAVATHAIGGSSKEVVGQANSMWIVNLYDLYCSSLAPNSLSCEVWKRVVSAGFHGRALVYEALATLRPGQRKAYRSQVDRFRVFARDLMSAHNSYGS